MPTIRIYYDGECPFCSRYATLIDLRRHGDIQLINLRDVPERHQHFREHGLDLDKGMVVEIDGKTYGGADAMHVISLLDRKNSTLAKIIWLFFSNRPIAIILYPVLRLGRNTLLLFLGRQRLVDGSVDQSRNELFLTAFGIFCWLHLLVYAFQFGAPLYPSTIAIGFLGIWLITQPLKKRLTLTLLTLMIVDAWFQAPSLSNHTILKNFLLLGGILAGAWHALRGNAFDNFMHSVMGLSRWLLLGMYFFGIFHKMNAGFLNPETSCSTALWSHMPVWLGWISFSSFGHLTSWGTLIIEAVICLSLLSQRFRRFGILSGIIFHSLLALSGYALYATFSMLSLLLHLSFLSLADARTIATSNLWKTWRNIRQTRTGVIAILATAGALCGLAWNRNYAEVGLLWIILISPLVAILVTRPFNRENRIGVRQLLHLEPKLLYIVPLLLFLNGFSPYLGLKTAQSLNMFANLSLEGGKSNHYLIRNVGPFGYLDDTVEIEAASGSAQLYSIKTRDLRMVYYDFLDQLDREPRALVTFIRDGERFINQSKETLQRDIDRLLHSRAVRKWFHFTLVDFTEPKPCALDR